MCEARVLEIIGKRPVGGVGTVMLNVLLFQSFNLFFYFFCIYS